MSKIVIISSTLRKKGNSLLMAKAFEQGATESGHDVHFVDMAQLNLKFCLGCLACQSNANHSCVIKDDMNGLYDSIQQADILVFATPVYYYEISGQLKTFLDRLNPLFARNNKFSKVYVLASCADGSQSAFDGIKNAIQCWLSCFDNVELAGIVGATGVTSAGEIEQTEFLQQCYQLAKSI